MDKEIILLILATAITISTIIYFTVKEAIEIAKRGGRDRRGEGEG